MPTDLWGDIERAAFAAFSSFANETRGLVAVINRALRYAKIDEQSHQIVIDRRAFALGVLTAGVSDRPEQGWENSATWFADWLKSKVSTDLTVGLQGKFTETDKLLAAFDSEYRVVASVSMRGVLEKAVDYARRTVNSSKSDLRHVIAAAIEGSATADRKEFQDIGWKPTDGDLADFRRTLLGRIEEKPAAGEDLGEWRTILGVASAAPAGPAFSPTPTPSTPPGPRPTGPETIQEFIASFSADRGVERPEGEGDGKREPDPLSIEPDVQAFARLICFEPTALPLSIGIFGGWGTGKSTFMERLERAIETLAKPDPKKPPPPEGTPRFLTEIVQIRFNAWHFADANLWASLTAEFFDQLRAGGYAQQQPRTHAALVERVNTYVHSLSSAADATRKALAESDQNVEDAQKARNKAMADAKKSETASALTQTLIDKIGIAYEAHKPEVREISQRLSKGDDVSQDIDAFVSMIKDVQTLGGRIQTIWKLVDARPFRVAAAVLVFGLVLITLKILWANPATTTTELIRALISLATFLGSAAIALAPAIRMVRSVAASTADFADELEAVDEEHLKQVVDAEARLQRAAEEAVARRQANERAARALVRYIDPNAKANPPRLLRFVLEDDPDTKAMEQQIGLISRARRLFQAVDTIVKEEKRKQKLAELGKLDPATDPPDLQVPHRIVLYIDDLDRCTPEQVYAVLQAVHLLLAFNLFVVVVAVDVAWVQSALARQLAFGDSRFLDTQPETERRRLAIAYLEKIFQIPFWLRRLSTGENGSYGELVKDVLGPPAPGDEPDTTETPPRNPQAPPRGQTQDKPASADDTQPDRKATPTGAEKSDKTETPQATVQEALATVQLTGQEVSFLASAAIGDLVAKEPRAVKRFLNIYRIYRARFSGEGLDRFLGKNKTVPTYPLVALIAAIECGQPIEVADILYEQLPLLSGNEPIVVDTIMQKYQATPLRAGESNEVRSAHVEVFRAAPLGLALTEVSKARGGQPISALDFLTVARQVRRYSFNRYSY